MLKLEFFPRFNDTDALGHINNASIATWFEEARRPVFSWFVPDLDPKKWNLIIARIEIDYLAQGQYESLVEVETSVEKIGTSSFTLVQQAKQLGKVIAKGKAIMVHFDYQKQKSIPIPDSIRSKLQEHS